MQLNSLLSIVGLSVIISVAFAANCTTKGDFPCYSCMGRDMENCQSGLTCCQGACFKLEDSKHNVIVKGCVNTKEEDASMKVRELDIPLYWADKEKVKGESYFCTGQNYCNSSNGLRILISISTVFFAFFFTS